MTELNDQELLDDYAGNGSEKAFAELVARHVNLVHATALRCTGNPHAAEEITQAVFIILARKAGGLSRKIVLSVWLYQTARLTAANFVRGEIHRQQREQEAYMQSTLNEDDLGAWKQVAPLLDEAMGRLGETDRNVVLLRFFENKTAQEVGAALKLTEAAAHKRVNRALEKLRKIFSKRGVTLATTIIAGAIAANSVQAAPAGLAVTVTAAAAKGAAVSSSTLTLIKGALKIMAWTKLKTAVVAGLVVLLAVGTTTVTLRTMQAGKTYSWQSRNANSEVLRHAPPQVKITRAKYPDSMGAGIVSMEHGQKIGVAQSAEYILLAAYGQTLARTIFLAEAPPGQYDFIANLPSGNEEALQKEAKNVFGLAGRRETRGTEVLLLKIQNPRLPGLKAPQPNLLDPHSGSSFRTGAGYGTYRNMELSNLAWFLEDRLKLPVLDQTGLTNRYDMDLRWEETDYRHPNADNLKQAVLDQLGLKLVPTNMPIEMLIVEKVK